MDSTLNLNTLANSLPNSNLANAEKDLLNDFKGILLNPTKFRLLTEACRLCLPQLPLLASPLSTGPLDRHRSVLTMPGT